MDEVFDSATDCRLIYNSPAQNKSTLTVLDSKLTELAQRFQIADAKKEAMLLVAAEMLNNQIKHAGGRGVIQLWQQPGPTLDILALDYGPGIAHFRPAEINSDVTNPTMGNGIKTIRRLSDESFTYSQAEGTGASKKWSGAIFLSRFHVDTLIPNPGDLTGFNVGLFSNSAADNQHNGDRIYLHRFGKKLRWLHLDGLGHGNHAQAATDHLSTHLPHCESPEALLVAVDRQLVGTRGAVAIFGEIDLADHKVQMLGVGDMHAHLYDTKKISDITFAHGILGREHQTPTPFQADFGKKCMIVTASDGIRRNLDLGNFIDLFTYPPQLIAYTLGNIMGRISDDQSLFIASVK